MIEFISANWQDILVVFSGVVTGASIALNALARFFPKAGRLAGFLAKLALNVPQLKK